MNISATTAPDSNALRTLSAQLHVPIDAILLHREIRSRQKPVDSSLALQAAIQFAGLSTRGILTEALESNTVVSLLDCSTDALRSMSQEGFLVWYHRRTLSDCAIPRDFAIALEHLPSAAAGALERFRALIRERLNDPSVDPVREELESKYGSLDRISLPRRG